MHFDFPAFKNFSIKAKQTVYAWWFPEWLVSPTDYIEFTMKDFDIDFTGHFELDVNGYLDPVVKDV